MPKWDLKSRLIKNSFWSVLSSIINRVGALVFTVVLARLLMPENYGSYSVVFSVIMILYTFADLGINPAISKYISTSLSRNKKGLGDYYHYLLKLKLLLAFSIFFILVALAYPLSEFVFKNSKLFYPFLAGAFYFFVLTFDSFYTWIFYALEKVNYVSFKETISQLLRITLPIAVFLILAPSFHLVGIFISLAITYGLSAILSLYLLKKTLPQMFIRSSGKINKLKVNKFIGYVAIANIATAIFSYVDAIMLGLFLKPEFVGFYRVAIAITSGIIGIAYSQSLLFLPLFSKLNKQKRAILFKHTTKYLAILAIPVSIGLIVLGKYAIKFLYDEPYLTAVWPLYLLSLLIFPSALTYIIISLFSAENKPQIIAKLVSIACILNVFLNLVFIQLFLKISPTWALVGSALATLLSGLFYFVSALILTYKEFSISMDYKTAALSLFASLLMGLVIWSLLSRMGDVNLLTGMGLVIIGAVVYSILLFLFKVLRKEDLFILKSILKNKSR